VSTPLVCSFCSKPDGEVRVVTGPGALTICGGCAEICVEVAKEPRPATRPSLSGGGPYLYATLPEPTPTEFEQRLADLFAAHARLAPHQAAMAHEKKAKRTGGRAWCAASNARHRVLADLASAVERLAQVK
jgi:ATP-dependent protease Clp ATPase subunit